VLHPDWRPCSVYPASYIKYPQHRQLPIQLKAEPTEPLPATLMPPPGEKQEKQNIPTRHHPLFQTEGYLYKYQYLYNQSYELDLAVLQELEWS
jgi:hypothetical protein